MDGDACRCILKYFRKSSIVYMLRIHAYSVPKLGSSKFLTKYINVLRWIIIPMFNEKTCEKLALA